MGEPGIDLTVPNYQLGILTSRLFFLLICFFVFNLEASTRDIYIMSQTDKTDRLQLTLASVCKWDKGDQQLLPCAEVSASASWGTTNP